MWNLIAGLDGRAIAFSRRISEPLARWAIFIVYAWFGALKVVGESPANPLVAALQQRTLPFIPFETFIVLFGIYEVVIGATFLKRGWERLAIVLMAAHMVTTLMPLVLVPAATWSGFLVPTLEGQYIIKNVALIALAIGIASRLAPMQRRP